MSADSITVEQDTRIVLEEIAAENRISRDRILWATVLGVGVAFLVEASVASANHMFARYRNAARGPRQSRAVGTHVYYESRFRRRGPSRLTLRRGPDGASAGEGLPVSEEPAASDEDTSDTTE